MANIRIVDYYSIRTFHEMINLCLINLSSKIFSEVNYRSGKSAQKNIKLLLSKFKIKFDGTVTFQHFPVDERDNVLSSLIREFAGFFITLFHYLGIHSSKIILFNYTNRLSLPFILSLNILLKKKVILLFHGELETLTQRIPFYKMSWIYKQCMRFSFRYLICKSNAHALVLGDSIKNNILEQFPQLKNNILSICHPYYVEDTETKTKTGNDGIIRIGTVGVMNKAKGLDSLLILSSKLKDLLVKKKLELYCIGTVNNADTIPSDTMIHWTSKTKCLNREEFEQEINKLDYFLFLYPLNSYKYTASGAIMDAIRLKKPIISLRNDYFDYLMGAYPIGYLEDSLENIENDIRKIVDGELTPNFSNEFNNIIEKISISSNAYLLQEQLRNIGYIKDEV